MTVFDSYSKYYNLLYKDKDYISEARFVNGIIKKYYSGSDLRLLDLGCGTGKHAFVFSDLGYKVTGIDRSEKMILEAQNASKNKNIAPKFLQSDILDFNLDVSFDVTVSLFHVISYLSSNDDIRKAFSIISKQLKPRGIFIFDCWYGPAVLSDQPTVRDKKISDHEIEVVRHCEPEMLTENNIVNVNYDMKVKTLSTGKVDEFSELHAMRYFFCPEINEFLKSANMEMIEKYEWMTAKPLGCDTWNAVFICRKTH